MDIKVTTDPKNYKGSHILFYKDHSYVNMDSVHEYHKRFDAKTEARGIGKAVEKSAL